MYFSQNLTQAQLELRNKKILRYLGVATMFTLSVMLFMIPEAHAAGLQKADSALQKFLSDIKPILRLVAIGAFILAGTGYMMNMIDKSMFIKIVVGIIIIGSANELVDLIWS